MRWSLPVLCLLTGCYPWIDPGESDGFDDFLVGAALGTGSIDPGMAFLVSGAAAVTGSHDIADVASSIEGNTYAPGVYPTPTGSDLGRSVASAGDRNGDGIPDIAIGGPSNGPPPLFGGAVFVYYGQ